MLKINGLISGYGSVQILNGANMKVEAQSIVALLGGNGTGKSTILKACSGLIRSWSGSISFNGEEIQNNPPHKIVEKGLVQVTQGKDVFPAMSVIENLRLGGFVLNSKQKLEDNLQKVFNYFPRLDERKNQLAATLSGGELQMLCIGRGLMSNPKMIKTICGIDKYHQLKRDKSLLNFAREQGFDYMEIVARLEEMGKWV